MRCYKFEDSDTEDIILVFLEPSGDYMKDLARAKRLMESKKSDVQSYQDFTYSHYIEVEEMALIFSTWKWI